MARWHYRDAGLLWLFLPAYLIHLAEEWFGGFPQWVAIIAGGPVPSAAFLIINGVAIVLLVVGIRSATSKEESGWIAVAVAAIALINTVSHASGSILTGTYSPGLISAAVLYVPLGSLVIVRALHQAPSATLTRGVIVGVVLHAFVFVAAFASTR